MVLELLGDVLKSELRKANGIGEIWWWTILLRASSGFCSLSVCRWRRESALIETARLI
jgi:hypothetical protein